MNDKVYLSLGRRCNTAFQIRRYFHLEDAYFYDWLITPEESLKHFDDSFENFLMSGNWEIGQGGIRVIDKATKLEYQHEFPTVISTENPMPIVDGSKVEKNLEISRSKFLYLHTKTVNKIKNTNTPIFIRSQDSIKNIEDAKNIYAEISNVFNKYNFNSRYVICSSNLNQDFISDKFIALKMNPSVEWHGCNNSWNKLFEIVENHFINN
jgi:hypothetical protein